MERQYGTRRFSTCGGDWHFRLRETTLAERLAAALGYEHIELDAIHWLPDWEMRPLEEFREKVTEAIAGETWVVDGNYGKVRDIVWGGRRRWCG